ncbi:MAG: neutral zinc metallopeptidase, partial [Alphaproteobacteria bacterium]|nr:neutral zinc metallopeptidase [Alphaproteobacteria bacterium]
MKWRGREQSSNIEDRRSQGGRGGLGGTPFGQGGGGFRMPSGGGGRGSRGGMGSLIGIVVVLGIIWLVTGQNPIDMLGGGSSSSSSTMSSSASAPTSGDQADLRDFVGVVVKETEDLWTQVFAQQNQAYTPPKVVLFSGQTNSGCGAADASTGPFYCPEDAKVYIDLSFYEQLRSQFGAPGDFAQAYVLAHEVGHHIQNITGVLPEFNRRRASMSQEQANAYSVRVELQADCYAGVWANYA